MRANVLSSSLIRLQFARAASTLLFMASALTALAAPPVPPTLANPSLPSLEQDLRLKRHVSIHASNVTLDDLLSRLSVNGLLLSADHTSGPHKLQIHLNHKTLGALMQSLAQLLPGGWETRGDGKGYLFFMSKKAVAQQEKWWYLFLSERERAKEAQRKFILKAMQTPPVRHRIFSGTTDPENESTEEETKDLGKQQFFNDLPPALQKRIADQMVDYAFLLGYRDSGVNEGEICVPLSQLPEGPRETLTQELAQALQIEHAKPEDVIVAFTNYGTKVSVGANINKGPVKPPRRGGMPIELNVSLCPEAAVLPFNSDVIKIVQQWGDKAPSEWKELARYQKSRVWPNDPPGEFSASFPPSNIHPSIYRGDILDWLADQGGIDLVADCSPSHLCQPMTATDKARSLPGKLKVELDTIAQVENLSWYRTNGGIYLFRNNRWYRDDALEIPNSLLQRWFVQLAALQPSPTDLKKRLSVGDLDANPIHLKARMDLEADIATKLTDWQIPRSFAWTAMEKSVTSLMPPTVANGVQEPIREYIFPFVSEASCILKEVGLLRFYAGLDADKRAELLVGRLSPTELTPVQQQMILYIAPTLRYRIGGEPFLIGLEPQPGGGGLGAPGAFPAGDTIYLVTAPTH